MKPKESEDFNDPGYYYGEALRENFPDVIRFLEDMSMECDQQTTFPSKMAERAAALLRKYGAL